MKNRTVFVFLAPAILIAGIAIAAGGNLVPAEYETTFVAVTGNAQHTGTCVWAFTLYPAPPLDSNEDNPDESPAEEPQDADAYGRARTQGIQIEAYVWSMLTGESVMEGAEGEEELVHHYPEPLGTAVSASSEGGKVRVYRQQGTINHTPCMTCDWKPKFTMRGEVVRDEHCGGNLQGTVTVTGHKQGQCQFLNVTFALDGSLTVTQANSPQQTTRNTYKYDSKDIESDTASWSCNVSGSASCSVQPNPPEGTNGIDVQGFLWQSRGGLDLHGNCKHCTSYANGLYDWY